MICAECHMNLPDAPTYHPLAVCKWAKARGRSPLTLRQTQVCQALADGNSTDEAAALIGIGWETLRTHLKAAMKRLDAHHQGHLIAVAMRQKLIR